MLFWFKKGQQYDDNNGYAQQLKGANSNLNVVLGLCKEMQYRKKKCCFDICITELQNGKWLASSNGKNSEFNDSSGER